MVLSITTNQIFQLNLMVEVMRLVERIIGDIITSIRQLSTIALQYRWTCTWRTFSKRTTPKYILTPQTYI